IKHRARAIAGREILTVFLLAKRYTELFEKGDSSCGRVGTQHVTDGPSIAAPEVPLSNNAIGDIASSSAAHQDLGTDCFYSVQTENAASGSHARAEDRRR